MRHRKLFAPLSHFPRVAALGRSAVAALPSWLLASFRKMTTPRQQRQSQQVIGTLIATGLVACLSACARATTDTQRPTQGIFVFPKKSVWQEDTDFVSMLGKRQDDNLLRISQQKAASKAAEEKAAAERVPPSMYRTAEPPLPEPDLSLPVSDVPRVAPSPSPKPN